MVAPMDVAAKTIRVSFTGHNPILCHDIVDAITVSFFDYDEEIRTQGANNSLVFINNQLDSLSNEITKANDSLLILQKKYKMGDPKEKETQIWSLDTSLVEKIKKEEKELTQIRKILNKIEAEPNKVELYKMLPEFSGNASINSLTTNIQDLIQLTDKRDELLYTFTTNNKEIKTLDKRIKNLLSTIRKNIKKTEEQKITSIASMEEELGELKNEKNEIPQVKILYKKYKNLIEVCEKYYKMFEEKKFTYAISNAGYYPSNRVLSDAVNPILPFSPNERIIYLSFLMGGLLIGLAFLAFKYVTFNEINNIEELKNLLPERVNILGGVPLTKQSMEFSQLVVQESPKSMLAEALI
jgi:uncharacterized protein involved in exopolysaccharide biosynthesis